MPKRGNGILSDRIINSHDGESVLDRLADQHAVERISVQRRQVSETGDAGFVEG